MKKLMFIGLLFILLIGCFNNTESTSENAGEKEKQQEPVTFKLATSHPVDHRATDAIKEVIENVESETEGRVQIKLFPANQLGDYTQVFNEVMRGTIDMAHISVPETHDERLGASMLPYLATSYEDVEKVLGPESYLLSKTAEFHKELGVKFFGFFTEGFIGIGTVDSINEPAKAGVDKGTLIRTSGLATMVKSAEALGFRTTTIPYAELFPALQTGVADGWIGGPPNLNYMTFRDVINHFYDYKVSQEVTQYIMNYEKFETLTKEDQKVLEEAFKTQSLISFEKAKQEDEKYKKLLKEANIEVVDFTKDEMEVIANAVREKSWPELSEIYSQELVDGILNDISK